MRRVDRRNFLTTTALFGSAMVTSAAWAQQTDPKSEPVYRISKNDSQNPALAPEANAHPLDPAFGDRS